MQQGRQVKLRPWQRKIIRAIYDSPTRRAIISFGRKNGKTALSAFLLLLHLCGPEARQNSQLYSAAQSRDQAAVLFKLAMQMVRLNPDLDSVIGVKDATKMLTCPDLGTSYRALSSEAPTAFGLSPVFAVHDELGQVKGPRSDLYDAIETGAGAQAEPLSIIISTQAAEDADLMSVLIDDAKTGADPKTKLFIFSAPEELDPFSVRAIRAANPAFGDFLNREEVLQQAQSAKRMPSGEATYRNYVLNQRVNVVSPFITRSVWKSCERKYELERFYGKDCFASLDLSATRDTTSLTAVFREGDEIYCWPWFWLPAEGLVEKARADRVPYDLWRDQGFLLTTPGRAIDHLFVIRQAIQLLSPFNLRSVHYDRWGMKFLLPQLEREGISLPLVEMGQGYQSMSPALSLTETAILNGKLFHPGHPILTNHAANAVVTKDPAGNRKLDKSKATGRIDGMTTLVTGTGAALAEQPKEKSFWE